MQSYGQEPHPQEQDLPFLRARKTKKRATATHTTSAAATINVAKFACSHAIIYNTPPKRSPIKRTIAATIHATEHCRATTAAAQRTPSSLRIEATAATQGV